MHHQCCCDIQWVAIVFIYLILMRKKKRNHNIIFFFLVCVNLLWEEYCLKFTRRVKHWHFILSMIHQVFNLKMKKKRGKYAGIYMYSQEHGVLVEDYWLTSNSHDWSEIYLCSLLWWVFEQRKEVETENCCCRACFERFLLGCF